MTAEYYPLQVLLLTLSGWVNREQQLTIEYLVEENRVLKEQLKGRRLRLTDLQRRRLAARGKRLGRRVLNRVATIVTPDTIMRWHRRLIAAKWTFQQQRTGRRGVIREIKRLVIRMASENTGWGYSRIQGALKDLGHRVGRTTVSRSLKNEGIKPAPDRPTSWKTFLKAHWGEIAAKDFFTTEVWTPKGLVTYYTLFLIDLKSRRVHIAGSTPHPNEPFMAQVARNLTDDVDGFLLQHRFLICDRDTKFSGGFRRTLKGSGVGTVLTPYRAPDCNAFAERFVRSIKTECLDRMIFFGEQSLHRAIREYTEHYHLERPHQGLGNELIERARLRPTSGTEVHCTERLGGLLRHYRRAA
ncbi:MAG: transposase [Planctomycetota bacterium]|jgi:transposase InsO family protein